MSGSARHRAAVARSLGWAHESAARGDYVDALAWVQVVEATGEQLLHGDLIKRRSWMSALAASHVKVAES
jgi:hypothetical protein